MLGHKRARVEDGFTLVEVLIAFAVLSTVLAVVFSSTASGLELQYRAARQQIALREAESLLEVAGFAFPLEPGTRSGRTSDGKYAWSLEIVPREVESQSLLRDAEGLAPSLYDVKAIVTWRERTGERSITLSTGRIGYSSR